MVTGEIISQWYLIITSNNDKEHWLSLYTWCLIIYEINIGHYSFRTLQAAKPLEQSDG